MKTRNLLLSIGVATLTAITLNAGAYDIALSPRAAASQIKTVPGHHRGPGRTGDGHCPVPARRRQSDPNGRHGGERCESGHELPSQHDRQPEGHPSV